MASSIGPTRDDSPLLGGVRVLFVEDDEDSREAFTLTLARRGALVESVGTAGAALAVLESARFDVLISDLGLPDMHGFELIKRVRALPSERGGAIPAAAVTALESPFERERALTAGFHLYVLKPVEPDRLAGVVAILANRREAVRRLCDELKAKPGAMAEVAADLERLGAEGPWGSE
jgi:CheY-like chemotaxis protein